MPRLKIKFGKRGLFDIEDVFAILIYLLIVFMLIVITSTNACTRTNTLRGLEATATIQDELNAEKELLDMLKTPLPDDLVRLIDEQENIEVSTLPIYNRVRKNVARDVLGNDDKIYLGKTYGEFIDNLQYMVDDSARNDVFAVVTRAVFVKKSFPPHSIELIPEKGEIYAYPEVHVKYGVTRVFDINGEADLSNIIEGFVGKASLGLAYAFIPLTKSNIDQRTATILIVIKPDRDA
jgi:hypothetical protein